MTTAVMRAADCLQRTGALPGFATAAEDAASRPRSQPCPVPPSRVGPCPCSALGAEGPHGPLRSHGGGLPLHARQRAVGVGLPGQVPASPEVSRVPASGARAEREPPPSAGAAAGLCSWRGREGAESESRENSSEMEMNS